MLRYHRICDQFSQCENRLQIRAVFRLSLNTAHKIKHDSGGEQFTAFFHSVGNIIFKRSVIGHFLPGRTKSESPTGDRGANFLVEWIVMGAVLSEIH